MRILLVFVSMSLIGTSSFAEVTQSTQTSHTGQQENTICQMNTDQQKVSESNIGGSVTKPHAGSASSGR